VSPRYGGYDDDSHSNWENGRMDELWTKEKTCKCGEVIRSVRVKCGTHVACYCPKCKAVVVQDVVRRTSL
jgi:hypothetical protein